jgi:hypothetical protein
MPTKPQLHVLSAVLTLLPLVGLSGCGWLSGEDDFDDDGGGILVGADVETTDLNNNQRIEPGETTAPKATFYPKDGCLQDVKLEWEACLFERDQWGWDWISVTLDGTVMCGAFETKLKCVDDEFQQGVTICLGGFCDYVMGDSLPSTCGWKITDMTAKNERGEVLHWFTPEFVESLGFHLLPVG